VPSSARVCAGAQPKAVATRRQRSGPHWTIVRGLGKTVRTCLDGPDRPPKIWMITACRRELQYENEAQPRERPGRSQPPLPAGPRPRSRCHRCFRAEPGGVGHADAPTRRRPLRRPSTSRGDRGAEARGLAQQVGDAANTQLARRFSLVRNAKFATLITGRPDRSATEGGHKFVTGVGATPVTQCAREAWG
jgi:hypothetical protein